MICGGPYLEPTNRLAVGVRMMRDALSGCRVIVLATAVTLASEWISRANRSR